MNTIKNLDKGIIITLLISALTFIGYYNAYAFEHGFLRFFNIPREFISVTLEEIIKISVVIINFAIVIYFALTHLVSTFANIKSKPLDATFSIIILLFFGSSIIDSLTNSKYFIIFIVATLLGLVIIGLLTLLIYVIIKLISFVLNKVDKREKKNLYGNSKITQQLVSYFYNPIFFILFSWILFTWITGYTFELFGYLDAMSNRQYMTFTMENEEYAILRSYPNKMLAVHIDSKTHKFTNKYRVMTNSDNYILKSKELEIK